MCTKRLKAYLHDVTWILISRYKLLWLAPSDCQFLLTHRWFQMNDPAKASPTKTMPPEFLCTMPTPLNVCNEKSAQKAQERSYRTLMQECLSKCQSSQMHAPPIGELIRPEAHVRNVDPYVRKCKKVFILYCNWGLVHVAKVLGHGSS